MADATYQPKVYHKQGGDVFVIASGGQLDGESGGIALLEDGFSFYFGGTAYQMRTMDLKAALAGIGVVSTYAIASASAIELAESNIVYGNTKIIRISMQSNLESCTIHLTSSPKAGMELWIIQAHINGTCAIGSVIISCSGVSLMNQMGSDHSRFHLINSTNSLGMAHLMCFRDGEWSIVDTNSATAVTYS